MIPIGTLCIVVKAPGAPYCVGNFCTVVAHGYGPGMLGVNLADYTVDLAGVWWGANADHIRPLNGPPEKTDTHTPRELETA